MSEVYKAIAAVQGELAKTGIGKESENTFDRYKFRGIDAVYNALAPMLARHGLCVMPRMVERDCQERVSRKGEPMFYVTVTAEFDFVAAADGSSHTVRTYGEAMDRSDKATNKAMSAAYKYAAFMTFAIPTEGDNDADASTPEVAAQPDHEDAYRPENTGIEGGYIGPKGGKMKLKARADAFYRDLLGCGDQDMLAALLNSDEVQDLKAELEQSWIGYLNGQSMPRDFEPINHLVRRLKKELPDADQLEAAE